MVISLVFSTAWPKKMGLTAEEAASKIINRVTMTDTHEKHREMIRSACLLGRGQRLRPA